MTVQTLDHAKPAASLARDVPTIALILFAALTFAITWGIGGAYIFFPDQTVAAFGEISGLHPLYFIATWGPGIAGTLVVLAFTGLGGLRAFWSRLFLVRCGIGWWLFVLIGLPLVFMAGSLVNGGGLLADLPEEGLAVAFLITFMMFFLGPMEEFGWRGVAQPLLQRHVAPIWAGALIGVVWGLWHLPAFYLSGVVYADWDFTTFMIGSTTLAILVTPIFNRSKGSLLLPMLFHWQLIVPFWPDAQPWDTYMLAGIAVIVAFVYRDEMFTRKQAVTEVVPGRARP